MKRIIISLLILVSSTAVAQDLLVKLDGEIIQSNIKEVKPDVIVYTKWDNPSGPTFTIDKKDVFSIQYKNGTRDVFQRKSNDNDSPPQHKNIENMAQENSGSLVGNNSGIVAGANSKIKIKPVIINVTGNSVNQKSDNELNASSPTKNGHLKERSSDGRCDSLNFGFCAFENNTNFHVEVWIQGLKFYNTPQRKSNWPEAPYKIVLPPNTSRSVAEITPGGYHYSIKRAPQIGNSFTTGPSILDEGQIYVTECEELNVIIR